MANNPIESVDPVGGLPTDYIIKETGKREKVNDGIEQVVSISQKDFDNLIKSWESFDIGVYYPELMKFTPLNMSVSILMQ